MLTQSLERLPSTLQMHFGTSEILPFLLIGSCMSNAPELCHVFDGDLDEMMFQNQLVKCLEDMNFTHDDLSSGRVSGIATVREEEADETSAKMVTVIELSADIRAKIFATFLQFLYTGKDAAVSSATNFDR